MKADLSMSLNCAHMLPYDVQKVVDVGATANKRDALAP